MDFVQASPRSPRLEPGRTLVTRGLHRFGPALLAAVLLLAGLAAAGPAHASNNPPYEPDPSSVGTLTFYDSSGNVTTTGRTDTAPFAAYAVGSTAVRSGDIKAALYFAAPDPGRTPDNYYVEQVGSFNTYPLTSGPANLQALGADVPVNAGRSTNQTLDGFRTDLSNPSTATGYDQVVQVRLRTASTQSQITLTYDVADVLINPTMHTWTQVYPSVAPAAAPGAPTNVAATAGISSANVTWAAPTNDGGSPITGYQVEYSSDGTTFTAVPENSTATAATITGLTPGTNYVFRVEARNAAGTSTASTNSGAVTPTAPTVPTAASNVVAVPGDAAARVSWSAPSSSGGSPITGYQVGYATSGSTTFTPVTRSGTATSAVISGLTNGTSYVFNVSAVNSVGTGPASGVSPAVTPVADASTLAIAGTASVRYGYTATITGRLTDSVTRAALAGQSVVLHGRHGKSGAWSTIKTVTTSGSGAAAVALKPTSYEQFYWSYAGTTTHKAIASAARAVTVSQTVAVKATATRVKAKKLIKVYGTVAPAGKGQRVYLQVYNHGWKTVTSAVIRLQTLPNHRRATGYVLKLRPHKGSKAYRVYKPATATLVYGASAQFHLAGK